MVFKGKLCIFNLSSTLNCSWLGFKKGKCFKRSPFESIFCVLPPTGKHVCKFQKIYVTEFCILTILIKEVLPAPLGPRIPKHSPQGTARYSPCTASFSGFPSLPGYIFWRLSQTMAWLVLDSWSNSSTFSLWKWIDLNLSLMCITELCNFIE